MFYLVLHLLTLLSFPALQFFPPVSHYFHLVPLFYFLKFLHFFSLRLAIFSPHFSISLLFHLILPLVVALLLRVHFDKIFSTFHTLLHVLQ